MDEVFERRKDYPEIKERLIKLEVMQQKDLDVAEEWRKQFCGKLDKLMDKVNDLPCEKREGRWISLIAQAKWLWIAVTFIMTVMTGLVLALLFRLK